LFKHPGRLSDRPRLLSGRRFHCSFVTVRCSCVTSAVRLPGAGFRRQASAEPVRGPWRTTLIPAPPAKPSARPHRRAGEVAGRLLTTPESRDDSANRGWVRQ